MVNFATLGQKDTDPGSNPAPSETSAAEPEREYTGRLLTDDAESAPGEGRPTMGAAEPTGPFIPGSSVTPEIPVDEIEDAPFRGVQPAVAVTGAPLLTMWLAPRRTIRGVMNEGSFIVVLLLAAFAGAVSALSNGLGASESPLLSDVIIGSLTIGPLIGILYMLIFAGVFWVTGKIFSGQARYSDLCAVWVWSKLPIIFLSIFAVVAVLMIGPPVIAADETGISINDTAKVLLAAAIGSIIWSLVLFVAALAEGQGWSIGKVIGNVLVTILLLIVLWFMLSLTLGAMLFAILSAAAAAG